MVIKAIYTLLTACSCGPERGCVQSTWGGGGSGPFTTADILLPALNEGALGMYGGVPDTYWACGRAEPLGSRESWLNKGCILRGFPLTRWRGLHCGQAMGSLVN